MTDNEKISVLVVDDSAFMRKALKRMLNSDPTINVIGDARDGLEALDSVRRLKPDVVTLDVNMPKVDGLKALELIMAERPTPVIMISSLTSEGGEVTLKALEMGALDFIDKSSCHTTMDILEIADSLVKKVKQIHGVDLKRIHRISKAPVPTPEPIEHRKAPSAKDVEVAPSHIVGIGTSTGGPMALEKVLPNIPADYDGAILVVQHMPVGFTRSLAERLNQKCQLEVSEAMEDESVLSGKIYIAPGGYHLRLRRDKDVYKVLLTKKPLDTLHMPSVDVMMQSIADVWRGRMLGVIMTGMGQDGAEGALAMQRRGAFILGQNEETCVVYGMPRAAHAKGAIDRMIPLNLIAREICRAFPPT